MSVTSDTNTTSVISDTSIDENLIYDTATVSKILGVQESTIRKYCSLMQKHNYEFNKNTVGHRIFYQKDIKLIKEIIELKNTSELTLNQAVKTILGSDIDDIDDINDIADVEPIKKPDYIKLFEEFNRYKIEQMTFNKEQMEFNKKLLEQLQKQENYIKHSIEARDNKLLFALKESMEARRQIAAAEAEREKEKIKWWKFWK